MADEKRKTSSLKDLLENIYEVHRKDIKTYTSGHLNSSKLLKPPAERHTKWETSDKPPIRYVPCRADVEILNFLRSFPTFSSPGAAYIGGKRRLTLKIVNHYTLKVNPTLNQPKN